MPANIPYKGSQCLTLKLNEIQLSYADILLHYLLLFVSAVAYHRMTNRMTNVRFKSSSGIQKINTQTLFLSNENTINLHNSCRHCVQGKSALKAWQPIK